MPETDGIGEALYRALTERAKVDAPAVAFATETTGRWFVEVDQPETDRSRRLRVVGWIATTREGETVVEPVVPDQDGKPVPIGRLEADYAIAEWRLTEVSSRAWSRQGWGWGE
jgi:hypothetical protein